LARKGPEARPWQPFGKHFVIASLHHCTHPKRHALQCNDVHCMQRRATMQRQEADGQQELTADELGRVSVLNLWQTPATVGKDWQVCRSLLSLQDGREIGEDHFPGGPFDPQYPVMPKFYPWQPG
jgi:hypothetical protein